MAIEVVDLNQESEAIELDSGQEAYGRKIFITYLSEAQAALNFPNLFPNPGMQGFPLMEVHYTKNPDNPDDVFVVVAGPCSSDFAKKRMAELPRVPQTKERT